jgi:hypothetical protein
MDCTELRPGNLVNFYSEFADRWTKNHILSENDIIAISAGIDKFEGIGVTLEWKINFYQHSGESIQLDKIKYIHEIQNYYFLLFNSELPVENILSRSR